MKQKQWFDAEMAAKYLGVSKQDFYARLKPNEFRLRNFLSKSDRKMMIHRKGLILLMP
jgi:hypothetical protein